MSEPIEKIGEVGIGSNYNYNSGQVCYLNLKNHKSKFKSKPSAQVRDIYMTTGFFPIPVFGSQGFSDIIPNMAFV